MIKTVATAAALFLATAAPATAQRGTYRAVGTEPFWSVTITPQRMRYETPDGPAITVPTPPARPMRIGRTYRTARLSVSIRTATCNDGMSDRTYTDTVDVTVGRRTLHGCGGAFVEQVNLTNSNWRITAIDGRPVPAEGRYRLDFTADRVSGAAGCNSLGGGYRLNGNRLTAGPLISTRMACPGRMQDEQAVFRILRGPVTVSRPSEQVLELRGPSGAISLRMVPGERPRR